jgi:hypothetical protein
MSDLGDETRENFMKRIDKKFKDNPELHEEIDGYLYRLTEIFGHEVEININIESSVENYISIFDQYNMDSDDVVLDGDGIALKDFIEILKREEEYGENTVHIDPINLKEGINKINDFLMTTIDNKVIIIPTIQ